MVFDLSSETIVRKVKENFRRRGKAVHKQAQEKILTKYSDDSVVSQALRYFAEVTLDGALPVFPALISLACEAVGGNPKDSIPFGEAIVFITAAADLHDDIIDKSIAKRKKATVLGKFGSTIAILAGDILLAEGLTLLSEATNKLFKEPAKEVMRLTSEAVFEISCAEALENQLRSKTSVSPQEYCKVLEFKSGVPGVAMEIGAILGNASSTTVKALGAFGRQYGVIAENIEEFADLFEMSEFQSRLQNECPPLPLLYALENPEIKNKFTPLLNAAPLSQSNYGTIVNDVLESEEVTALINALIADIEMTLTKLPNVNEKIRVELANMLLVQLECLR
jgi:geranylgeranyl pyrophosphate synthase